MGKPSAETLDAFLLSIERRAYRIARIATGHEQEALDVFQEAAYKFLRTYADKPSEEWRPLFFGVLHNQIRDWRRRSMVRSRWRAFLDAFSRDGASDDARDPIQEVPDEKCRTPEAQAAENDTLGAVEAAVRTLPPRQQQAFLLRAWEELSLAETAQAMGCSEGSVKTHYHRAVERLRGLLGERLP
ncbi:RNA polymerase, sigma-24 subunit, ECF subfamily [Desulfovibrio sp. X2]|uniref:RNA polymerase sigma factor n=1 Tax=Desulfovibrio sp. X2 TaxID=941449 RepID=UPI000358D444|nr:RNA polymerase sigma factor [Desulfovibrio sp. X2]EPR44712.1 RNA polymerase, sigma-24 subunit, ECF subfamily [Desulfovibrio sp. X2]